jgi:glutathione synthase
MLDETRCLDIHLASRGVEANHPFFQDNDFSNLDCIKITKGFSFDPSGLQFLKNNLAFDPLVFDIIFLRLPRPVSDEFLEKLSISFNNLVIINNPLGIIECSSKSFLLNFPEWCPPIKLCRSKEDILQFNETYDMVLKPLREYGGKGIIKITKGIVNDGINNIPIEKYLPKIEKELIQQGYLAMKFLPNVSKGDKRLLVVNGKILASSLRLPKEGSWLCNVAQGGSSVSSEETKEEIEMIKNISPILMTKGILIYGADTLENDQGKRVLSEINALSIGGFPQAEKQTGKPIIKETINEFFNYVEKQ